MMKAAKAQLNQALDWLDSQQGGMFALLEKLVNTDSGSSHVAGVSLVGDWVRAELENAGVAVHEHRCKEGIPCLRAEVAAEVKTSRPILLVGHRDTVFPQGTAEKRPFALHADRAYGPGVADMKGGVVLMTYVLMALNACGWKYCPVQALYTTDEEIGSPLSRSVIEALSKNARAVFNAEPGRPGGKVVVRRKGMQRLNVFVTGRAAHAGSNPADGASAIEELCRKVHALHQLSDEERGMTVNVGTIRGGDACNIVAPHAEAQVDLRFASHDDQQALMAQVVRELTGTQYVEGTSTRVVEDGGFPPFEHTEQVETLFQIYKAAAAAEGVDCEGVFVGGASDAGIAATTGVPVLCGIGPEGAQFHSEREYLIVHTLLQRSRIALRTLFAMTEKMG